MTDYSLGLAKSIYDKIIQGTNVSVSELKNVMFCDKLKDYINFSDSPEFQKLIYCFDFNNDQKIEIEDFNYLKDHISDLSIFLKLTKLSTLTVSSFKKLKNISIPKVDATKETQEAVVRVLLFTMLFIIVTNVGPFCEWAKVVGPLNKTNGELLYSGMSGLIMFIDSHDEIASFVKETVNFFREKCGCKCSCFAATEEDGNSETTTQMMKVQVQINSLSAQIHKETAK